MRVVDDAITGRPMTTFKFRVIPLPTALANRAREEVRHSAHNHTVVEVDSPRSYPCRHCLSWAQPGERVIVFTYASIPADRPYAESGPIVIHEQPCVVYSATNNYPPNLREGRVVRAYDSQANMIDATVVNGDEPEAIIAKLFTNPATAFLQVRSVTRGCFTFKIERDV
jgi:hypothetical protein